MPLLFEMLPDEARGKIYALMTDNGRQELKEILEPKQEPVSWEQPAVDLEEIDREMRRPPEHMKRVV